MDRYLYCVWTCLLLPLCVDRLHKQAKYSGCLLLKNDTRIGNINNFHSQECGEIIRTTWFKIFFCRTTFDALMLTFIQDTLLHLRYYYFFICTDANIAVDRVITLV